MFTTYQVFIEKMKSADNFHISKAMRDYTAFFFLFVCFFLVKHLSLLPHIAEQQDPKLVCSQLQKISLSSL